MKAVLMIVLNLNHKQSQIQNGRKMYSKGEEFKAKTCDCYQARKNICRRCGKRVKTCNH